MRLTIFLLSIFTILFGSCSDEPSPVAITNVSKLALDTFPKNDISSKSRTVHVFVALCDNKNQGIVPVGKSIGNGQDPENNLYWGCSYGVRTYFKRKASDWKLLQSEKNISPVILERLLFKHRTENVYLLADAYDGAFIKQTTIDFLNAAGGKGFSTEVINQDSIRFGAASDLIAYIGHDGLMDFSLPIQEPIKDTLQRQAIILACYSKNYFGQHLNRTGTSPLLWTTGLMAPEAYTLHDALNAWVQNKNREEIRMAAASAYARYQKCSVKAAKNLLVTGW
jgi:hypothetical protein